MPENLYNLLRTKEIIAILDGDTNLSEIDGGKLCMPYLSGPTLCEIATTFGLPLTYDSRSRWMYMDDLMEYCIKNDKTPLLLAFLFKIDQFRKVLAEIPRSQIEFTHKKIVTAAIEKINTSLYFGGHELRIINTKFEIKKINATVVIETPAIKKVDADYVKDLSNRALADIERSEFDSALTKSRTLLEETFCYVIELQNQVPTDKGNINALYKQVKGLYKMHADKGSDERINMLLSGLEKIISGIAAMRNNESDSHGVGKKRIGISEHHARLFVNASMTMCDFILVIGNNANKGK